MTLGTGVTGTAAGGGNSFVIAAAARADDGISVVDLAAALGLDLSGVPEPLVPTVHSLALAYEFTSKRLAIAVTTEHTGWLYAATQADGGAIRAAGVRAELTGARVSNLPVVGDAIPAERDFALTGVRFSLASKAWTAEQTSAINELLGLVDAAVLTPCPRPDWPPGCRWRWN